MRDMFFSSMRYVCTSLHSHKYFLSPGSERQLGRWEDSWVALLFSQVSADVFPRPTRPQGCRWEAHSFSRESHLFFLAGRFSDTVFDPGVQKFHQSMPRYVFWSSTLPKTRRSLSLYRCRLFFREMSFSVEIAIICLLGLLNLLAFYLFFFFFCHFALWH